RELRKDLPLELEAIILKAMAGKADDRYPSAQAMAEDLEKFVRANVTHSGSANVGSYVRALFGDERVLSRSKIPSLTELAGAGVQIPGLVPEIPTRALDSAGQAAAKKLQSAHNTQNTPTGASGEKTVAYEAPPPLP